MWCSRAPHTLSRRAALFGALSLSAACGFRPVYGPDGPATRLSGQVAIEAPATDAGFELRNRLIDRLGPAEAPAYLLQVEIAVEDAAVAVTTEQETTRYNLPGTARYRLTRLVDGALLAEGQVQSFASYSATGSTVSTATAADDALSRLALGLADLIFRQLLAVPV
jgi:Predicted secreted (periplasmic) protein